MPLNNARARSASLSLLLPALLALGGCTDGDTPDYFQFEEGNSWELRVIEGTSEQGELWKLDLLNADDNPDTGRGDYFFKMTREFDSNSISMRAFNIALNDLPEGGTTYVYKWANNDEGVRNEDFIEVPSSGADWSAAWDYEETDPSGSDFTYEVSAAHEAEPLQTSWGTYDDCIEYRRTLNIVNYSVPGVPDPAIVQVRTETYALGVGLIRYQITASDGAVTEGRLSNTNVVARPGS